MGNLFGFVAHPNQINLNKLDSDKDISNKDLKEIILQLYKIIEDITFSMNQVPEMVGEDPGFLPTQKGYFPIITGSVDGTGKPVIKRLTSSIIGINLREIGDTISLVIV